MTVNLSAIPGQMFRGRCRKCDWTWDVVALPMPIERAAHVIGSARCPMCGNGRGNTMAEPRPLTDAERAHKARVPASARAGAASSVRP